MSDDRPGATEAPEYRDEAYFDGRWTRADLVGFQAAEKMLLMALRGSGGRLQNGGPAGQHITGRGS